MSFLSNCNCCGCCRTYRDCRVSAPRRHSHVLTMWPLVATSLNAISRPETPQEQAQRIHSLGFCRRNCSGHRPRSGRGRDLAAAAWPQARIRTTNSFPAACARAGRRRRPPRRTRPCPLLTLRCFRGIAGGPGARPRGPVIISVAPWRSLTYSSRSTAAGSHLARTAGFEQASNSKLRNSNSMSMLFLMTYPTLTRPRLLFPA